MASAGYSPRERTFFSPSIQTKAADSAAVCASNETLTLTVRLCFLPFGVQESISERLRPKLSPQQPSPVQTA